MIIDFRVRPQTDAFVSITKNAIFESYAKGRGYEFGEQTVSDLVSILDANGIDYGVFQGRDISTTFGWSISNDLVATLAKESAGRLIGFAGLDPNRGMLAVEELERSVEGLGLKGAALDPYMHKIPADHPLYYPIYARLVAYGLPVVLTSGWAFRMPGVVIEHAAPSKIDRVATDFPDLKIVVSHGAYPYIREMVTVAYRHENVYFEWSGMENKPWATEYVEAANSLVSDKVLFASAYPFIELDTAIARYEAMPLDPVVREKLMGGNAARILNLG